jgi:cytochrome c
VSDVPTTRAAAILTLAVAAALLGGGSAPAASAAPEFRVLVFTKTAGFRHDSIPTAVEAVSELGGRHGFQVDATENAASSPSHACNATTSSSSC